MKLQSWCEQHIQLPVTLVRTFNIHAHDSVAHLQKTACAGYPGNRNATGVSRYHSTLRGGVDIRAACEHAIRIAALLECARPWNKWPHWAIQSPRRM